MNITDIYPPFRAHLKIAAIVNKISDNQYRVDIEELQLSGYGKTEKESLEDIGGKLKHFPDYKFIVITIFYTYK